MIDEIKFTDKAINQVNQLVSKGYWVRGVDIKKPEYEASKADEFEVLDLRRLDNCLMATRQVDEVYHLAADMGGIGYINFHHADAAGNNVLISTHLLESSRLNGVKKFFFANPNLLYSSFMSCVLHLRVQHYFEK